MGHSRTSDQGLMASRRTAPAPTPTPAPPCYGVGGSITRRVCTRPADTERLLQYLDDGIGIGIGIDTSQHHGTR